jgi:N-acetyltransferase
MQSPTAVPLSNAYVNLVPISAAHAAGFAEIGADPGIWSYLPTEPFQSVADAQAWITHMLERPEYAATYSVFDAVTGAIAGSTSYLNVSEPHGSLEIGFTWYGRQYQRTHINTATKLALLTHAFEVLHATRVQLQTDARNIASQSAIARIGGVQEGTLRKHKTYPNGFVRDTVVFSIIDDEWPVVQKQLERMLGGRQ